MASSAAFELVLQLKDEASRGLNKVAGETKELDRAMDGAQNSSGGFFGGLGGGVAKIGALATGIGAVVVGGSELVGFFKDAATAAAEEQVGIDRLNQSLANSIPGWDGNTGAIEDYISKQEQLAFADDELRDSLNFLVTQTKDLGEAQELQAAAMDLARAKNITLEQATRAVGRVDQENINTLKKLGIEVTENMTKEEALAAIRTASAGQAETYANSMQGSMDRVGIAFDNAKETIGGAIMQGIQPLLQGLATFISGPEFQGFIQGASAAIGAAFQAIGAVVGTVWGFIQGTIIPIAQAVFSELQKWWTEIEPEVTAAWQAVQTVITDAWNFIQPLLETGLNFLKTLWEEVWPGIQQTFSGVWTAIQGILQVGWSIIQGIWNTVTSILKGDWEGAWNAIKTMFEGVWKGVETFLSGVWATIKGIWETATAYLGTLWETAWTGIQNTFTGVWTFITQDLPVKLGEIWAAITGWITTTANELGTKIGEFVTAFWNWITTTVSELPGKLAEIWNTITNWIGNVARDIWTGIQVVGTQIVEGIKAGITGAWDAFVNWVTGLLGGIVDGIKEFFGISSPSRLMAEQIGEPMVMGMQAGWDGAFPAMRSSMLGDMDGLGGALGERAAQIAQMMQNLQNTGSAVAGGGIGFTDTAGGASGGGSGTGAGGGIQILDRGGIVTGPRLAALAMDSRPEAVIPLDRLERWMGRGGGGREFHYHQHAPIIGLDTEDVVRKIAEKMYDISTGRP